MKRTALRRGPKRLARQTRVRSRRTTPRRTPAVVDLAYRKLVAGLSCAAIGLPGHQCSGEVIAHHAGTHGTGQKCSDHDCIPVCNGAHGDLHDRLGLSGTFKSFTKSTLRQWEDAHIARTRSTLADHIPSDRTSPQVGHDAIDAASPQPPPP